MTSRGLAGVRAEVLAFARVMSVKIDGHNTDRGEYGWRTATKSDLYEWLRRYYGALCDALGKGLPPEVITSKAANVANLSMMIADVFGDLPRTNAAQPDANPPHATETDPARGLWKSEPNSETPSPEEAARGAGECLTCDGNRYTRHLGRDNDEIVERCPDCNASEAP